MAARTTEREARADGGCGSRNGRALLLGALLGMALAGYGVLAGGQEPEPELGQQLVARVNGRPILRSDYQRALAAVAADRRGEIDDAMRRHVLDRLIDEELLVQRGIELGLAERDRRVRADLSGAVIELLSARGQPLPHPSEAELRAFYRKHQDYFRGAAAVRIEAWFVGSRKGENEAGRQARLVEARRLIGGARDTERVAEVTDPLPLPLPNALLSAAKLTDYLGPEPARRAVELNLGELSEALAGDGGHYLLRPLERRASKAPNFTEVRKLVLTEWRRRAGEQRLRSFLDQRRAESEVVVEAVL